MVETTTIPTDYLCGKCRRGMETLILGTSGTNNIPKRKFVCLKCTTMFDGLSKSYFSGHLPKVAECSQFKLKKERQYGTF